jgi:hypothetical protein
MERFVVGSEFTYTSISDVSDVSDVSGISGVVFKVSEPTEAVTRKVDGVKNTLVQKVLDMCNGDMFYCIIAGGYALNAFMGNESGYRGDIDLWVIRKRPGVGTPADADVYINRVIATIIELGGYNIQFNNSTSTPRKCSPTSVRKNKYISVKYETRCLVRSLRSVNFTLSKYFVYKKRKVVEKITKDFQIILKIFDNPGQVIENFDVDVCKIAYVSGVSENPEIPGLYMIDGSAVGPISGKYNVLNLNRFSATYIQRLCKYMNAGFALVMPTLSYERVQETMQFLGGTLVIHSTRIDKHVYVQSLATNVGGAVKELYKSYTKIPRTKQEILYLERIIPLLTITNVADEMRVLRYGEIMKCVKSKYPNLYTLMYIPRHRKTFSAIMDHSVYDMMLVKYESLETDAAKANYIKNKSDLLVRIQAEYVSLYLPEYVREFNEATNTSDKRWNVSSDLLFNFSPVTDDQWFS